MTLPRRTSSSRLPGAGSSPARPAAALVAAVALLALAGCAGSTGDSGGDAASTFDSGSLAPGSQANGGSMDGGTDFAGGDLADGPAAERDQAYAATPADTTRQSVAEEQSPDRSLIATGNVALSSDDVGQARFDVQKVVDRLGGEVAEENTEADPSGRTERSRLVLRVPSEEFDEAMTALKDVADLITSSSQVEDVTTQVIDVDVRTQLQRRSIERISILLDRAQSIRDIVNIERELSRREAELDSLEKRQAFLADQTSQATITVSLERPSTPASLEAVADVEQDSGFLDGLAGGWRGLGAVTVAVLTVGGAVLPFAVVVLLLGWPVRLLVQRSRERRAPTQVAAES